MENPFTSTETALFRSEGWNIFTEGGEYQIQRLDNDAVLRDDQAAWELVWAKAKEGSALHIKVLTFLMDTSPAEYTRIMEHCDTSD